MPPSEDNLTRAINRGCICLFAFVGLGLLLFVLVRLGIGGYIWTFYTRLRLKGNRSMKRKSQRGQDDCDGLSSLLSPQERTEYRRLSSSQQSLSPISTIRGMATQGGSQNTDTEGYIKRRETPLYTMNKSKWVCTDKHGHVDEFEFDTHYVKLP